MAELMLVANPKRRHKKRRARARRRNPSRHRRHRARRSNPARRYHRARARRNPSHRRRHYARRRSNPVRRYRRRRNPLSLGGLKGMIKPVLMEGLVGAGGALALDAAWGYINPQLPATISSSPYLQFAVKCLAAIGVGFIGNKVLKGKGRDLAVGGVTVAMHDMLKSTLQSSLPSVFGAGGSLALSGYGAYLSGSAPIVGTATFPRTYQANNPGFGAYLSGDSNTSDSGCYVGDANGMDPWNTDS